MGKLKSAAQNIRNLLIFKVPFALFIGVSLQGEEDEQTMQAGVH